MNEIKKLQYLKRNILQFMNVMKSRKNPGYYRYSYGGDLFDDRVHWNVGSSVFALKIYYTLGIENNEVSFN